MVSAIATLRLTSLRGLSYYDATYVALAGRRYLAFATFDFRPQFRTPGMPQCDMQKQTKFRRRDYNTDQDYALLDSKFRRAKDLEYVVLLGHVIVEDRLLTLLTARLGADTMPKLRGFDTIAGLALAGSRTRHLRDAAELLNVARNEVGHKMYRKNFPGNVESFVRAVKGNIGKAMTWPRAQGKRIDQFRLAIRFFIVELELAICYEDKRLP